MIENVYSQTLIHRQQHRQLLGEAAQRRLAAEARRGRRIMPFNMATLLTTILWGLGKIG